MKKFRTLGINGSREEQLKQDALMQKAQKFKGTDKFLVIDKQSPNGRVESLKKTAGILAKGVDLAETISPKVKALTTGARAIKKQLPQFAQKKIDSGFKRLDDKMTSGIQKQAGEPDKAKMLADKIKEIREGLEPGVSEGINDEWLELLITTRGKF